MSLFEYDQPEESGMSDDELCAYIEDRRRNSIGYNDTLKSDRKKSLQYYMGEATGDLAPPEVDGRSKVVSKDLMDTIEWIMPSMMRIFAGTENVVGFEPSKAGQEENAQKATIYCNYTLLKRNNGFRILHDAIKSALIQRVSFVKIWNEEDTESSRENYTGLSQIEFEALQASDEVSITEASTYVDDITQMQLFDVEVMRSVGKQRIKIVGVPQEELFIDGDATSDEDASFVCHERDITISDLISMGYDRELIESLADDDEETDEQVRRSAVGLDGNEGDNGTGAMRKVTLQECYLKVDYDDDGIAEWRKVHKAGSHILLNEDADGHPIASCSAILMPYSYIGLSFFDLLNDLVRIKTALQRQMLDNMYLINNARTEVVEGQVNLDDLLNPRPGGIVRVKQVGSMREIMPTPVANEALSAINHFDHVRQVRTGVTEYASATNADAISKSSGVAVDMLQSAAKERIELIARVIGETFITRIYKLILKCALQNQSNQDQIYIAGSLIDIDPREWDTQYNMTVSVGLGTQSRAAQVAQLDSLLQRQMQGMPLGITRTEHIAATYKALIEAMGYKNYSQYMVDPMKEKIQAPPPPPDPNQALVQIEQTKSQSKQAEIQLNYQLEQQTNAQKAAFDEQDAKRKFELEKYKVDSARQENIEKEAIKAQSQERLKMMDIQFEAIQTGKLGEIKTMLDQVKAAQTLEEISTLVDGIDSIVAGVGQ